MFQGACDPCTGYPEQAQAHAELCHTFLGLLDCAVLYKSLKPKLNWLIITEKLDDHYHLEPVMMPQHVLVFYLERKQLILLLRKSYENLKTSMPVNLKPERKSAQYAMPQPEVSLKPHLSHGSQHQKGHKVL